MGTILIVYPLRPYEKNTTIENTQMQVGTVKIFDIIRLDAIVDLGLNVDCKLTCDWLNAMPVPFIIRGRSTIFIQGPLRPGLGYTLRALESLVFLMPSCAIWTLFLSILIQIGLTKKHNKSKLWGGGGVPPAPSSGSATGSCMYMSCPQNHFIKIILQGEQVYCKETSGTCWSPSPSNTLFCQIWIKQVQWATAQFEIWHRRPSLVCTTLNPHPIRIWKTAHRKRLEDQHSIVVCLPQTCSSRLLVFNSLHALYWIQ